MLPPGWGSLFSCNSRAPVGTSGGADKPDFFSAPPLASGASLAVGFAGLSALPNRWEPLGKCGNRWGPLSPSSAWFGLFGVAWSWRFGAPPLASGASLAVGFAGLSTLPNRWESLGKCGNRWGPLSSSSAWLGFFLKVVWGPGAGVLGSFWPFWGLPECRCRCRCGV